MRAANTRCSSLGAYVEIALRAALPAPTLYLESVSSTTVHLSWTAIDGGRVYAGSVLGWIDRGVNYALYVGTTSGFDPMTEGTRVMFGGSTSATHHPDMSSPPYSYYYKVAATLTDFPEEEYMNFSNVIEVSGE